MTSPAAILEPESTARSRRALLVGALGGIGAWVALAIGRPGTASALDPNDVVLGANNAATTTTRITNNTTPDPVFVASSTSAAVGIMGESVAGVGVSGISTSHIGETDSSIGVVGESNNHVGVSGYNQSGNQPAIRGWAAMNSTGVLGYSGEAIPPVTKAKTGVFGYAAQDASSRGVTGGTKLGQGVRGEAMGGVGVRAAATTGTGLHVSSTTGLAIRAAGRVRLENCAGLATIVAGTNSVVVTPGIDLVAASAVVATLQGSAGGTTTVHRCVVNTTADTLTIYLTANASTTVKVAWIVLG